MSGGEYKRQGAFLDISARATPLENLLDGVTQARYGLCDAFAFVVDG